MDGATTKEWERDWEKLQRQFGKGRLFANQPGSVSFQEEQRAWNLEDQCVLGHALIGLGELRGVVTGV